jgi:transposase
MLEQGQSLRTGAEAYQEGPGFRFLATRGGRPPLVKEPSSTLGIVRERARRLRVMREQGLPAALALGGCSRASLFRWQAAYERGGLAALAPGRRGPRSPRRTHPAWLEQIVVAMRLRTYWSAKRIAADLRERQVAVVSHGWIERLFDDLGTARSSDAVPSQKPRGSAARVSGPWRSS